MSPNVIPVGVLCYGAGAVPGINANAREVIAKGLSKKHTANSRFICVSVV